MGWLRTASDATRGHRNRPAGRSIPDGDIDLMRRAATALSRGAR